MSFFLSIFMLVVDYITQTSTFRIRTWDPAGGKIREQQHFIIQGFKHTCFVFQ